MVKKNYSLCAVFCFGICLCSVHLIPCLGRSDLRGLTRTGSEVTKNRASMYLEQSGAPQLLCLVCRGNAKIDWNGMRFDPEWALRGASRRRWRMWKWGISYGQGNDLILNADETKEIISNFREKIPQPCAASHRLRDWGKEGRSLLAPETFTPDLDLDLEHYCHSQEDPATAKLDQAANESLSLSRCRLAKAYRGLIESICMSGIIVRTLAERKNCVKDHPKDCGEAHSSETLSDCSLPAQT